MFDRKLIDYLPPVLQSVMEFAAINEAQQPEIEAAWDALSLVMNNQFIDTATNEGLNMWENELNIVPCATDTLEDRKQRIKVAWAYGVVYTYNWLVGWLKDVCKGHDSPKSSLNQYTLHITLPISVNYRNILDSIRKCIPANILINPSIALKSIDANIYAGFALQRVCVTSLECNIPVMEPQTYLTDETGAILTNEEYSWLI